MYSYSSVVGLAGSNSGRFIEVIEHKFYEILRLVLKNVHVDEAWYRQTYPDVEDAIAEGRIATAREHYLESGYFEDRLPHRIVVDASWYMKTNPDVVEAIRLGKVESAEEHFLRAGFREGRLPFPGWSLLGRRN